MHELVAIESIINTDYVHQHQLIVSNHPLESALLLSLLKTKLSITLSYINYNNYFMLINHNHNMQPYPKVLLI